MYDYTNVCMQHSVTKYAMHIEVGVSTEFCMHAEPIVIL